jgi:hypothetical protein
LSREAISFFSRSVWPRRQHAGDNQVLFEHTSFLY